MAQGGWLGALRPTGTRTAPPRCHTGDVWSFRRAVDTPTAPERRHRAAVWAPRQSTDGLTAAARRHRAGGTRTVASGVALLNLVGDATARRVTTDALLYSPALFGKSRALPGNGNS